MDISFRAHQTKPSDEGFVYDVPTLSFAALYTFMQAADWALARCDPGACGVSRGGTSQRLGLRTLAGNQNLSAELGFV